MAEANRPHVVVGRPAAAIELPTSGLDYCEFHYVWDSAASERRRREFATERPLSRYIDIRIIVDGTPIDLTAEDLLRLRRRKISS